MTLAAFIFAFLLNAIPFSLLFWACVRKHGWIVTTGSFLLSCGVAATIHLFSSMMKGLQ